MTDFAPTQPPGSPGAGTLGDRLASGDDIDAILFSLLDPAARQALARCALVRSFSPSLYDDLLRAGGPELDELVSTGRLEPAPSRAGSYRVAGPRVAAFTTWWTDEGRPAVLAAPTPAALRDLAAKAAEWYAERGDVDAQLDMLVVADPEAAAPMFRRLYGDADAESDLARCQDLLDIVEHPDRVPLYPGTALMDAHAECRADLAARTMWAADFRKSAQYFRRRSLERHLDELLTAGDPRVLQLYAKGGMGKTMQLRWFLGRRCAGHRPRVPCARIDFDHEDPSQATRSPWLVVLRVVEQLEPQLVGEHFQAVLDCYGSLLRLLYPQRRAGAVATPLPPDDATGRDIVDRVMAVLAERPADQPIVLVCDTCEELLRPGIDPCALVELLAEMTRRAPALRLVLAGRYDLTGHECFEARSFDVKAHFPGLRTLRVQPFNADEQRRYLTELRQVTDPDIVAAIIRRSSQSPFHLAAFADLVRLDPEMTPQKITAVKGPGLLYCIERILKRVEPDVRWLLFYGIVPRRLSYEFLQHVMWPLLVRGIRAANDSAAAPAGGRLPLPPVTPPEGEAELRELWKRLLAYVSTYSWAWPEPDGEIAIHPLVVEPLREVARREAFYQPLHKAAIAYYEERAARDDTRWDEWTCESIYHRFQLEGSRAAERWQQALLEARHRGGVDALRKVAGEPLRREYLNEEGQPLPFRGRGSVVSWDTVAQAHVYLAWALADSDAAWSTPLTKRGRGRAGARWVEVRTHLDSARQIAQQHGATLPQPETNWLEARLALALGDVARARDILQRITSSATPLHDVIEQTRQLIRFLMDEADDDRETGSAPGSAQESDGVAQHRVALTRAGAAMERGMLGMALGALDRARRFGSGSHRERAGALQVSALVAAGAGSKAYEIAHDIPGTTGAVALAQAHLANDRPRDALATLEGALGPALAREASEDLLELCRTRSAANAELLRIDAALVDLYGAAAAARGLHDGDAEAGVLALTALLHLRQIGDLRNAARCVDEAEGAGTGRGEGALAAQLAAAELHARSGAVAMAVADLARARRGAATPIEAIRVEIAELVERGLVGEPSGGASIRQLLSRLAKVDPPTARLVLLTDLREVAGLGAVPDDEAEQLWDLAAEALLATAPEDRPHLSWRAAEVARVAGRVDDGRELLQSLMPAAAANPFLWWRWIDGMSRCGPARPDDPRPPEEPLAGYSDASDLRAAWLVRLVQHRSHLESAEWAMDKLGRAAALLQRPRALPTKWGALLDEARAAFEPEADRESGTDAAATASVTWARLGQMRQRGRLASDWALGDAGTERHVYGVELRLSAEPASEVGQRRLQIELGRGSGPPLQKTAGLGTLLSGELPDDEADASSRLRAASWVLGAGWTRWARQVGSWLGADGFAAAWADTGSDLRIVCSEGEVAAPPWELLATTATGEPLVETVAPRVVYRCIGSPVREENEISAAQSALLKFGGYSGRPDGLVGARTDRAIRAFQESVGVPADGVLSAATWRALRAALVSASPSRPLRVLLLRQSPGTGARGGARWLPMTDVESLYRSHGARVDKADLAALVNRRGALLAALDELPDVVHLQASVDFVGGGIVIETGPGPAIGAGSRYGLDHLSTTAFGDVVAELTQGSFGPTVVIETPWRQSRTEAVRALLLRNALGQNLLELGRTAAVLCTGGAPPHVQHAISSEMICALASGHDVAEVARVLQSMEPPDLSLEQVLPRSASALFLQRSPHTLFPVASA